MVSIEGPRELVARSGPADNFVLETGKLAMLLKMEAVKIVCSVFAHFFFFTRQVACQW